jgi:hypothetical protein
MAKFVKKPIVIEAEQWFPGKHVEGVQYPPLPGTEQGKAYIATYGPCGIVETLEGRMVAMPGDWIITGIKGEIYPCKPDIFEATYLSVSDGGNLSA